MRLLQSEGDGGFSLMERVGDNIPPYAILSHTWGADNEEVTFKDLMDGTGTDKVGYEKLTFCGKKAASDGLEYFWVDTCCIDKSSSSELAEAINSMFQWYRNSTKCYVYLTDVSSDDFAKKNGRFENSRWFTRGWTLQELVAPKTVEFFSSDKKRIGDKNSMVRELHSITEIAPDALHGAPLSRFSVEERMAWAARRNTKREEDGAYCLLGVFDVSMTLIYGEGRDKAFIRLRKEIKEASIAHVPPQPKSVPGSWNVPFLRNRHFVGQEVYLNKLENLLCTEGPPPAIAITGLGGVGKTQIAIELAHRMRKEHSDCSIFWLPATSAESIQQGFEDIARLLNVHTPEQEQDGLKKAVQHTLNQDSMGRWLLILDNVDDMELWSSELKGFLPRRQHGCVVCTTRSREVAVELTISEVIEVSEMGEQTGLNMLSKLLVRQELLGAKQDAQELLRQLTFLPLAITQAAAYINKKGVTLSDYLSLLKEQEEEVVELLSEDFEDMGRYNGAKNPVAITWLLSFEQMRSQNLLAAEYLSFMACVDTKAIPVTLLPPAKTTKLEMDALGTLSAYYFISPRTSDDTFDVHRLVHLAMRNWLRREGALAQWTVEALKRLDQVLPKSRKERGTMQRIWRTYLPHARRALDADVGEAFELKRGDLLESFATCLYDEGRYAEAETYESEVLQLRQRVLGSEHQNTLSSKRDLADTYISRGRFKEAEEMAVSALNTSSRVHGDEDQVTLDLKELVADICLEKGRWTEAENIMSEVLESRKRLHGGDHMETVLSMSRLADVYIKQRRWKEAEELGVQVMSIYQKRLGNEHPDTLTSMNDLGVTYLNQGRLVEAEEMYMQVIKLMKRVLGEKHPYTLTSLALLARTYAKQKRLGEAEMLYEEVIEASKAVLGEKHYVTLERMDFLAALYRKQARWKEAEELGLQIMDRRLEVLGNEHEYTLHSMGNLGLTYTEQERFHEAEQLEVQVLEASERVLGEKHPDTLVSMNNLACTWKHLERDGEAIALMEKCLELRKEVLGPEDPATKRSLRWLTMWHNETLKQSDASEGGASSELDDTEEQIEFVRQDETGRQEGIPEQNEGLKKNESTARKSRRNGFSKLYHTSRALVRRTRSKNPE